MRQTTQHVPQRKARGTTVLAALFLGAAALVLTAPASLALIDDDLVPDLPTESPLEPVESLLGTPAPVPSEATEDVTVTQDLTLDNPLGEILGGAEDGGNGGSGGGDPGGDGGGGGTVVENGGGDGGTSSVSGSSGTGGTPGSDGSGAETGEAAGTTAGGTYGPASSTTGTLNVSYGTFAGRAAANTAGRALRMAGPLAAPLTLAAVALATLLALGRGPNRLIKSEAVAIRRTYRL